MHFNPRWWTESGFSPQRMIKVWLGSNWGVGGKVSGAFNVGLKVSVDQWLKSFFHLFLWSLWCLPLDQFQKLWIIFIRVSSLHFIRQGSQVSQINAMQSHTNFNIWFHNHSPDRTQSKICIYTYVYRLYGTQIWNLNVAKEILHCCSWEQKGFPTV